MYTRCRKLQVGMSSSPSVFDLLDKEIRMLEVCVCSRRYKRSQGLFGLSTVWSCCCVQEQKDLARIGISVLAKNIKVG